VVNPEDLENLVALGDSKGLVKAVKGLGAAERKKLSKTAQALWRDIDKVRWKWEENRQRERPLERLLSYVGKRKVTIAQQAETAEFAVLAVGPLTQLKRIRFTDDDLLLEVLRDRRPEWINDWVATSITGEFPAISWHVFWTLCTEGLCEKPDTEDYYRFMARTLVGWEHQGQPRLSDRLSAEPLLLEDIWKLFEVDTTAFARDWAAYDPTRETWPAAILKLGEQGQLDRDRLLDATLAGLTTGFKLNLLSGFAKLHEQLEPTHDEMASRQSTYCDLLSAQQPQVVGFAVTMIKQLDRAKRLDDAAFIASSRPTFDVSTKGPPRAVIGLLKKIAKRNPRLEPSIGSTLVGALYHSSEDIQGAAIDWYSTMTDHMEPEVVQQISAGWASG
jgi:hypothetical protein